MYTPLSHECEPVMSTQYMVAEVIAVLAWNSRYSYASMLNDGIAAVVPCPFGQSQYYYHVSVSNNLFSKDTEKIQFYYHVSHARSRYYYRSSNI